MAEQINIGPDNPFDELRRKMEASNEADRLKAKFKKKSYRDRNRWKYHLSLVGAIFSQLGSIVTASTFVFSYILSHLIGLNYGFAFASTITVIVLVCMEVITAKSHIEFWERFNQSSKVDGTALKILAVIAVFGLVSNFWSYSGGFELPAKVQAQPTIETPTEPDYRGIESKYLSLSEKARSDAQKYYTSRSYLNKLSNRDSKHYASLLAKPGELESQMNEEIRLAKKEYNQAKEKAVQDLETAMSLWAVQTKSKGIGLGGIAICLWLLMAFCYWYKEKYEYDITVEYNSILAAQGVAPPQVHHTPQKAPNPSSYFPAQTAYQANPAIQNKASGNIQNSIDFEFTDQPQSTEHIKVKPFASTPLLNTKPTKKPRKNTGTQREYSKPKGDTHPTVYSKEHNRTGTQLDGNTIKIHHAGLNKKKEHKDYLFSQKEVNAKIREYNNRFLSAEDKYNNDPSSNRKRILDNNATWLKYWQDRSKEF